jgi:energy-coupling factor transporter ATP-binding protein EcfA2
MTNGSNSRIATKEIVDLLLPQVRTQDDREMLVLASWGPGSKRQYDIDYSGSAREFSVRFVDDTLKFGKSLDESHTAAIELVLDYLRTAVGSDQQPTIDRLLAMLREVPDSIAVEPPYMGLQPYREEDSRLFFGRSELIKALLRRIDSWDLAPEAVRFLAIIGASGSGKSSLVKAGLLPQLREAKEGQFITITPGAAPMLDLALPFLDPDAAGEDPLKDLEEGMLEDEQGLQRTIRQRLAQDWTEKDGVLLFVDQFEQLFTAEPAAEDDEQKARQRAERQAFVNNLLYAASVPAGKLRLLITMRADFYHRCADYDNLRAILVDHQEYIGALNVQEITEIIEKPAELMGYMLESGLTEVILDDLDAGDGRPEPGSLPLLSHALYRTWHERSGFTLQLSDYQAAGGVKGALRNTADEVYQSLDPDEQQLVRFLFLRLTQLGEGTEDTRRRVYQDELKFPGMEQGSVERVIGKLTNARLLVTGQDRVRSESETGRNGNA